MELEYMSDRYCYALRKLPKDLHYEIYKFISVDIMVHEWMYTCDLNDIVNQITDKNNNNIRVMHLANLLAKYDKIKAKLFIWRHTIPLKQCKNNNWYDDKYTDYKKMINDFCKILAVEYGRLLSIQNQTDLVNLYKVLSVLIYCYKNPRKTLSL